MGEFTLRPATLRDAELLRTWRNDPEVRKASRDRAAVGSDEHAQWLRQTLADPKRSLLIAELDGRPAGQVRFDAELDNVFEISVSLSSGHRGAGLGRQLIEAGLAWVRSRWPDAVVEALVREENIRSREAFLASGFREAAIEDPFQRLRSDPGSGPQRAES